MKLARTIILPSTAALILALSPSARASEAEPACPSANEAVTTPAPVEIAQILETMATLTTLKKKPLLDLSSEVVKEVHNVFDLAKVKTKMEQFYRLLYVIQAGAKPSFGSKISLAARPVQEVLLKSKVFTNPEVPRHITSVSIDRTKKSRPKYEVLFDQEKTLVPLNKGEGFYLFRNGKCQHAKQLIFRDRFTVTLSMTGKGNLKAKEFRGVDLFGDFGNRGMIDVDIEYVELRSVEFYRGTNLGKVTAYVSTEEFKKNDHNPFLRLITKFVPDRSVQPIDW